MFNLCTSEKIDREGTLAPLLHPLSEPSFWEEYYEQQPCLIHHEERAEMYAELPDIEGLETLLWAHESKLHRSLRVNRHGNYLPLPPRSTGKDLFRWAIDRFAEGYTLVLNGVDTMHNQTADLARRIEVVMGGKIAANAFLTPPNNHGFNPHFDTHDVFILQLEGRKLWKLFDVRIEKPLDRQIFFLDQSSVGNPVLEVELVRGDLLYIPRGMVHGAFTGDEASLQMTMGYRPFRWSDLLRHMVDLFAESSPDCRASVRGDRVTREQELQRLAEEFQEFAGRTRNIRLATERHTEGLVGQLRPLPGGHISNALAAPRIDASTRVRRRPEATCHVFEHKDKARLQFPGIGLTAEKDLHAGCIEAPLAALGLFKKIASATECFTAEDLTPIIRLEDRVEIVRRLVAEGLLVRANFPGSPT